MFFNGSVMLTKSNDAGLMQGFDQHQLPLYYSSESELFIGDLLQLQLYKTSESIRVIHLHLISVQEMKDRFL